MENKNKTQEILCMLFEANVDTFKEQEAKEKIIQYIREMKDEDSDYEKLSYSLFIQDTNNRAWQNKSHFYKVFFDEIDCLITEEILTQTNVDFLLRFGKYLKWEMNLVIDEKGIPLNQKKLSEKLKINVRTFQKNIQPLIDNNIILEIKLSRENFYMVNPYVIFVGKNINKQIPKLFDMIGYTPSKTSKSRTNRRKTIEKRGDIGD